MRARRIVGWGIALGTVLALLCVQVPVGQSQSFGDLAKRAQKQAQQQTQKAQGTVQGAVRRSLAQLRKLGLEAPTKPAIAKGRKSAKKLLAPFKQGRALGLSAEARAALESRAKMYADLEAKASPAERARVAALREQVKKKGYSFSVGVTGVSEVDIEKRLGAMDLKPDPRGDKRRADKRKADETPPNLVRHGAVARLRPPADIAQRTGEGDVPVDADEPVGASEPVVSPTVVSGTKGAAFPSSVFPSPSLAAFSWRDRMTTTQDQGDCGSCWAFALTSALETVQAVVNRAKVNLSEQFLVNCATPYDPGGDNCEGHAASRVATYLLGSTGVPLETAQPYVQTVQTCRAAADPRYKVTNWGWAAVDVNAPKVAEIKKALIDHGPLASVVHAGNELFMRYQGGVFDANVQGNADHAVTIVGWDDTKGAWHVRNSWGQWGEEGYAWIKYGTNHIGERALWVETVVVPRTGEVQYTDRLVSVENTVSQPVKLFVLVERMSSGKFSWTPTKPGASAKPLTYTLEPGAKLSLKYPSGKYVAARKLRIWAQLLDGTNVWSAFKGKDFIVTSVPYTAAKRQRITVLVPRPKTALPTPEGVLKKAHELRVAGKLAEARVQYQRFVTLFPEAPAVHEARYWVGRMFLDEGRYEEAAGAYYDCVFAANEASPYFGYSLYDAGVAYLNLGRCGYATRALEVVVYGELAIEQVWVDAANDLVFAMQNDDGSLCSDWD